MRVLTGANKNRRLSSKVSIATRPTSSRVRKSIFDILWSRVGIDDKSILDLFAGTGALGIEALSRGARQAHFVDHSANAIKVVRENLNALGIEQSRYKVLISDFENFLNEYGGPEFDIAFLDPPYSFDEWPLLLRKVPASVMVCETGHPIDLPPECEKTVERRYGTTYVTLASRLDG